MVYLYFANKENTFLKTEERTLMQSSDPAEIGSTIIEGLIKGPYGNLIRTLPEQTRLNALYVAGDGTAFVDFSENLMEDHPGGVQSELLTIYSVVNSLVLNIPQVSQVKILIKGRETSTVAGHIDARFPFKANMMLVR